jgi:hypothetical protein
MKKPKLDTSDVARWLQVRADQQFIPFFEEQQTGRYNDQSAAVKAMGS